LIRTQFCGAGVPSWIESTHLMKRVRRCGKMERVRRSFSEEVKRSLVEEIERGVLSIRDAASLR
jgi:transposase-like protein